MSQHASDMPAQLALRLDNLAGMLGEAGISLADLVWLTVYITDVALPFPNYGVLLSRMGAAGVASSTTMLGSTRPALPILMVNLEGNTIE